MLIGPLIIVALIVVLHTWKEGGPYAAAGLMLFWTLISVVGFLLSRAF